MRVLVRFIRSHTTAVAQDPNHLLMTTSGFVVKENPYEAWHLTGKMSAIDLCPKTEDRIMVRPKDLRKALLSVCNEKSSEDSVVVEQNLWGPILWVEKATKTYKSVTELIL